MFKSFLEDDHGAQVVEYALVIAVMAIVLVIALQPMATNGSIAAMTIRVASCLGGSGCS